MSMMTLLPRWISPKIGCLILIVVLMPSVKAVSGKTQPQSPPIQHLVAEADQLRAKQTRSALEQASRLYLLAANGLAQQGKLAESASLLNQAGVVFHTLSDWKTALKAFDQAVGLYRQIRDLGGEATTLSNLATTVQATGHKRLARELFEQALKLYQVTRNESGEATVLNNLGSLESEWGQKLKAIQCFEQAQNRYQRFKDINGLATTANNIGAALADLGKRNLALDRYQQALTLYRQCQDQVGEATALINIAAIYHQLADHSKALDMLTQAEELLRTTGDRSRLTRLLGDLGLVYAAVGNRSKASQSLTKALELATDLEDFRAMASLLNKLGGVALESGQLTQAHGCFQSALKLHLQLEDQAGQAAGFNNLGTTHLRLGQMVEAQTAYRKALVQMRMLGDRAGEAAVLDNLSHLFQQLGNLHLAILFGKQAVNCYQELRADAQMIEPGLQRGYVRSLEPTYRALAENLITAGRLLEAEKVYSFLKTEEYFEFTRRSLSEKNEPSQSLPITPAEAAATNQYQILADRVTSLGVKRGLLIEKSLGSTLSKEDATQLDAVEAELEAASQAFQRFLIQMETEYAQEPNRSEKLSQVKVASALIEDLRELSVSTGRRCVALYTLIGQSKVCVVVVTPETQTAIEIPIIAAEFNRKILAFRQLLQEPELDPRPVGKELYDILFKPLEKVLAAAQAEVLMWALDGTLRYIPLTALYDGEHYLIERYTVSLFTPASNARLKDPVSSKWRGLGLGVSQPVGDFEALPGAKAELLSIIKDESIRSTGLISGRIYLDSAFTSEAFRTSVRQRFPLVHIASHFVFQPGTDSDSYLLLGDGNTISLEKLRGIPNFFGGTELLTLSACETALSGTDSSGREIEGFGITAQNLGAKAVIATLWSVADTSTRALMQRFYRLRETQPELPKGDLLRQAQCALLKGNLPCDPNSEKRGLKRVYSEVYKTAKPFQPDPKAPFAHPYFWAPFVLIGNWK